MALKKILPRISSSGFRYDPWKLVNRNIFLDKIKWHNPVQIISDIDKTYLETSFDSITAMAKIALEDASDKQTVTGAKEFLKALIYHSTILYPNFRSSSIKDINSDNTHFTKANHKTNHSNKNIISGSLHFVSSSPTQLRSILEQKIAMDYISCVSDCFKDQVYNLKFGKLSLIKQQISYKLCALLSLIVDFKNCKRIILIGDNKESDAIVYLMIKFFLKGIWNVQHCIECLKKLDVPESHFNKIFKKIDLNKLEKFQKDQDLDILIMIRLLKDTASFDHFLGISSEIIWFQDYLDLALISYYTQIISSDGIDQFLTSYQQEYFSSVTSLSEKIKTIHDDFKDIAQKNCSLLNINNKNIYTKKHSTYIKKILNHKQAKFDNHFLSDNNLEILNLLESNYIKPSLSSSQYSKNLLIEPFFKSSFFSKHHPLCPDKLVTEFIKFAVSKK